MDHLKTLYYVVFSPETSATISTATIAESEKLPNVHYFKDWYEAKAFLMSKAVERLRRVNADHYRATNHLEAVDKLEPPESELS